MADDQVGVAGVLQDGTPVRLHLGDAPPDISPPFTEERQAAATGH
jgi:hypothetical protein